MRIWKKNLINAINCTYSKVCALVYGKKKIKEEALVVVGLHPPEIITLIVAPVKQSNQVVSNFIAFANVTNHKVYFQ